MRAFDVVAELARALAERRRELHIPAGEHRLRAPLDIPLGVHGFSLTGTPGRTVLRPDGDWTRLSRAAIQIGGEPRAAHVYRQLTGPAMADFELAELNPLMTGTGSTRVQVTRGPRRTGRCLVFGQGFFSQLGRGGLGRQDPGAVHAQREWNEVVAVEEDVLVLRKPLSRDYGAARPLRDVRGEVLGAWGGRPRVLFLPDRQFVHNVRVAGLTVAVEDLREAPAMGVCVQLSDDVLLEDIEVRGFREAAVEISTATAVRMRRIEFSGPAEGTVDSSVYPNEPMEVRRRYLGAGAGYGVRIHASDDVIGEDIACRDAARPAWGFCRHVWDAASGSTHVHVARPVGNNARRTPSGLPANQELVLGHGTGGGPFTASDTQGCTVGANQGNGAYPFNGDTAVKGTRNRLFSTSVGPGGSHRLENTRLAFVSVGSVTGAEALLDVAPNPSGPRRVERLELVRSVIDNRFEPDWGYPASQWSVDGQGRIFGNRDNVTGGLIAQSAFSIFGSDTVDWTNDDLGDIAFGDIVLDESMIVERHRRPAIQLRHGQIVSPDARIEVRQGSRLASGGGPVLVAGSPRKGPFPGRLTIVLDGELTPGAGAEVAVLLHGNFRGAVWIGPNATVAGRRMRPADVRDETGDSVRLGRP